MIRLVSVMSCFCCLFNLKKVGYLIDREINDDLMSNRMKKDGLSCTLMQVDDLGCTAA